MSHAFLDKFYSDANATFWFSGLMMIQWCIR